MKVNTIKKLAVSTMAIAMGAALVGSISGSVAWYQYSTRSTVSYSGASAHCTESLQVRLYEDAIAAVPAVPGAALANGANGAAGTKYYTKVASTGAGHLDDGESHYVLAGEGTEFVANAADTYFPLTVEGSDAVAAVGDEEWKSDLRVADVKAYLDAARGGDYNLRPVTSGALAVDTVATTFYKNPIYQYESQADWGTGSKDLEYVDLPLQFRVVDVDGERDGAGDYVNFLAKNVYVSKLEMNSVAVVGKEDISDALRVGFDGEGTNDVTFSNPATPVSTFGKLDLNNDDIYDLVVAHEFDLDGIVANEAALPAVDEHNGEHYGRRDTHLVYESDGVEWTAVDNDWYCSYGGTSGEAASYSNTVMVANDADPNNIVANKGLLGQTNDDGSALKVNVRIYLEGWQLLEGSAMWADEDYVGAAFRVNMRFSSDVHSH